MSNWNRAKHIIETMVTSRHPTDLGDKEASDEELNVVGEKHIGFKKLKNKLAHEKGVTDPAALAASIGRKKLGNKEMTKRAKAGRK